MIFFCNNHFYLWGWLSQGEESCKDKFFVGDVKNQYRGGIRNWYKEHEGWYEECRKSVL